MNSPELEKLIRNEVARRRTFAIISHPDAGKTTLTEKLLLYAGMVRTAGMVRGRKQHAHVSSDWMAMEQDRGISITASAMQFNYKGKVVNVLDTPGHQDFSEDTYRTLTAADSAVMVIDAAKGIETQTRKLFEVCRLRNIPILTFINKMDMPAEDPYDLVAEVEEVLQIDAAPVNWPIGMGKRFRGVAECESGDVILFEKGGDADTKAGTEKATAKKLSVEAAVKAGILDAEQAETVAYDLELLSEAGNSFSRELFLAGESTPVFFGSALTNFGVEPFFDAFCDLAPAPAARMVDMEEGGERLVDPAKEEFSAYVFKMQANMDKRHRDSMAFLRVCSGLFERDITVKHASSDKDIRLSRSHSMFGGERTTLDAAYPGDIVGVVNPGVFTIGDTISVEGGFAYKPLPKFPPEVIAQIRPTDLTKRKAFDKGIEQFADEGAVLILRKVGVQGGTPLIAAVGRLQFEVLQSRLENEYGVTTAIDELPQRHGSWLVGDPESFKTGLNSFVAKSAQGRFIVLYTQEWEKRHLQENNPEHELKEYLA